MDKITVINSHYNLSGNIDFLEGAENLLDKVHRQALKEVKRETIEITEEEIEKQSEMVLESTEVDSSYKVGYMDGFTEAYKYIKSRINQ